MLLRCTGLSSTHWLLLLLLLLSFNLLLLLLLSWLTLCRWLLKALLALSFLQPQVSHKMRQGPVVTDTCQARL